MNLGPRGTTVAILLLYEKGEGGEGETEEGKEKEGMRGDPQRRDKNLGDSLCGKLKYG